MTERMTEAEIASLLVRRTNRDGTAERLCNKAHAEITALRAENERLCPICAPWQPMTREEADKMQADLVEQMKANAKEDLDGYLDTMRRLNAENERLRAALERLSCECPSNCDWEKYGDICPSWIARAALEGKP